MRTPRATDRDDARDDARETPTSTTPTSTTTRATTTVDARDARARDVARDARSETETHPTRTTPSGTRGTRAPPPPPIGTSSLFSTKCAPLPSTGSSIETTVNRATLRARSRGMCSRSARRRRAPRETRPRARSVSRTPRLDNSCASFRARTNFTKSVSTDGFARRACVRRVERTWVRRRASPTPTPSPIEVAPTRSASIYRWFKRSVDGSAPSLDDDGERVRAHRSPRASSPSMSFVLLF